MAWPIILTHIASSKIDKLLFNPFYEKNRVMCF